MKEYGYMIFQIKDIRNTDYSFMGWDYAKNKIMISDYDGKYYSHINGDSTGSVLEKLFEIFNINHPEDFKGHSLSVSDIVVLFNDDGCTWHYCDTFGWKDITAYLAKERG